MLSRRAWCRERRGKKERHRSKTWSRLSIWWQARWVKHSQTQRWSQRPPIWVSACSVHTTWRRCPLLSWRRHWWGDSVNHNLSGRPPRSGPIITLPSHLSGARNLSRGMSWSKLREDYWKVSSSISSSKTSWEVSPMPFSIEKSTMPRRRTCSSTVHQVRVRPFSPRNSRWSPAWSMLSWSALISHLLEQGPSPSWTSFSIGPSPSQEAWSSSSMRLMPS